MAFISRLTLHNFRNYADRRFDLGAEPVAVIGANGSGKTNILEALSLYAPGRGLRSAALADMQNMHANGAWAIAASLQKDGLAHDIATGLDPSSEKEKRIARIDGDTRRSANIFLDYVSVVWLTPQMDKLWLEDKSARRKFLDRLTSTFDPAHLTRISRYETALRERLKLMQEPRYDESWVLSLERIIAETGVAIAAHRIDLVQRLNAQDKVTEFPHVIVHIDGWLENLMERHSALEIEDLFLAQLLQDRARDALIQQTTSGPHRSDFLASYHKDQTLFPAALCSTGEQKALLISLILSHSALIQSVRGAAPLLLLDEILLHLDAKRQNALLDHLTALRSQFWVTQTNEIKNFSGQSIWL